MPKLITLLLIITLLISLSGCAYVNTRAPYDEDLNNTDLGSKVGMASNYSLLWLAAWGDASYAAAAKNGEITVLKHSDVEVFSVVLGLYVRRTTIVYGD